MTKVKKVTELLTDRKNYLAALCQIRLTWDLEGAARVKAELAGLSYALALLESEE